MFAAVAKSIFGSANDRYVRGLGKYVDAVNAFEPNIQALTDDELRGQTELFRQMVKRDGAGLVVSEMIASAAMVRENRKTLLMAKNSPEEFPMSVQLAPASSERYTPPWNCMNIRSGRLGARST